METKTIRQTIISDDDVRAAVAALKTMPERVRVQQDLLADAKFELDVFADDDMLTEELKDLEAGAMYEVLNDVGEDGKKKYTNETQRKEACRVILLKNQDYIDIVTKLARAKRRKAELVNHVAKLNNQVGAVVGESFALRAVAEIIAGLSREDNTAKQYDYIARTTALIDRAKQTMDGLRAQM